VKNKIRILCFVLMLILLLPTAFGCFGNNFVGENETPSSEESSDASTDATPATTLAINGTALSEYTIVYSGKSRFGGDKAAKYFNEKLDELYGTTLSTERKSQQDRYEIVLGLDGGDAAIKEAFEKNPTGVIGTSGKRVVLMGDTYASLSQLIDAFLAKATGNDDDKSISVTALEVPEITTLSLKVMSYNILGDMTKPGRPADAREQMVATILQNDIDVFGTQEDNHENNAVFMELLGTYSSYKGVGEKDNGNHIYWKTDKFDLIKQGFFYLSNTPGNKSKYEDSTQYRTLSYVILKDKETGKQFLFVDAHLDYQASEATRIKQITVLGNLIGKIKKSNNVNDIPIILLGDFNTISTKENGAIPKFLSTYPSFVQTSAIAEKKGDTGETLVSQEDFVTRYHGAYDYIFVSVDNVCTNYYTVVDNVKDGKYPSDHLPVMAVIDVY